MNKFLIGILVLLLATGFVGPRVKDAYDGALYISKTDGYADAKAKYAPVADPKIAVFARAFCEGDIATMEPYVVNLAMLYGATSAATFLADAGFMQQTCDEVRYLGSFVNSVNETEYVYLLTMPVQTNWFVFTFGENYQVVSVK